MKKLKKKEKLFCDTYCETRDFIQTKMKLGYEIDISKAKFRAYIQSVPVLKNFEIPDDPILRTLYAIATFDDLSMRDDKGDVKPLKSLTDEQRMAIRSYRETDDGATYTTYNKQAALDMLMKHKGLYKKDNEQSKPEVQVGVINITKDEVKKIDKILENDC